MLSATFFCTLLVIFACKKKSPNIGQNNIDQNTLLSSGVLDTFTISTFSYMPDSIISSNPAFAVLGSYVDPDFGSFNSEIYSQVRLAGLNPAFGDVSAITIDSFVLSMEYIGYYGKTGTQTIEVYELGEDIYDTASYYSFTTINHLTSTDLVKPGFSTYDFDPTKITVLNDDTVSSQLRVRLDESKAMDFINEASTGTAFVDNDAFLAYFKGIHIKTNNGLQSSGDGGAFYFNFSDPDSKMTIYYTQNGEQNEYDFSINSSSALFNHVEIDNAMTDVETVINDTVSGLDQFYAQSFGARAVIQMPGLDSVPVNAVIHDAYIELPVSYQTGADYAPGFDASVSVRLDKNSTQLFGLPIDAPYDDFSKSIKINLRSYVQALINGEIENNGIVISPLLYNTSADRIIFNGVLTNNKAKPKFSILYTEF